MNERYEHLNDRYEHIEGEEIKTVEHECSTSDEANREVGLMLVDALRKRNQLQEKIAFELEGLNENLQRMLESMQYMGG